MSADIRLLRWHERDREDYERLASAITRLRTIAARGRGEIVASAPAGPEEPDDVDRARALLAQRRARDTAAGDHAELFGEPGWDILLTLFVAYEEGHALPAATLATGSGLRPGVLERWLKVLQARELIRPIEPQGTASATLSLTDKGMALVLRCVGDA